MSDRLRALVGVLARPADASYRSTRVRVAAALYVGVLAGVVGALAMYPFRMTDLAPAWASESVLASVVLATGILVKLLCEQLRASVAAFVVATAVGGLAAIALRVLPFALLGLPALGGYALLPVAGDTLTFVLFGQFPLQLTGYLLGVVYDGARA
jgi:hypothetical protein